MDLDRFLVAQDHVAGVDRPTAFSMALAEIQAGAKRSHWIWFVFPQGPFGESSTSKRFAIRSPGEAVAYLRHPILGSRLLSIAGAAASRLDDGANPRVLMNGTVDCLKLASSMTLFRAAADECDDVEMRSVCSRILEHLNRHGWPECSRTLEWWDATS